MSQERTPILDTTNVFAAGWPTSVPSWLPFLWRRVLFPGSLTADTSWRWQSLVLLLLLPSLLLYPSLAFPLIEPDEGRYAEIPREMMARGDWVVPYLQGEPYLDKPPLFYWLVMLSYHLWGVRIGAARLVPALVVHSCILLTYALGRRSVGERGALRGALLLSLTPGLIGMGRLLLLDSLLTVWVVLSLFSVFEALRGQRLRWHWWLLGASACGLGVLTKGPIALVLLAPPVWLYRRLQGATPFIRWLPLTVFLGVVFAMVLPWYIAVYVRLPGFASYFFWKHNVLRFLAPFDHIQPVWFYGPILLLGFLPGMLLAVSFIRFLFSGQKAIGGQRIPELGFLLLAAGWCVFFFTLSGCKLPTYILPAFPPLALAFGYFLSVRPGHASRRLLLPAGIIGAILLAGQHFALPWYARYRSPLGQAEKVIPLCSDPQVPIVCYPRHCDSVAFYLGRDDLRSYRSKETHLLVHALSQQPRTVILFTHRHSLTGLCQALPPSLRVVAQAHCGLSDLQGLPESLMQKVTTLLGETSLGLCDVAVVENQWLSSLPPRPLH